MLTWILDNGHGGMIGAEYQTAGKRSPVIKPGIGVFEGEFNRDIVKRVAGAAPWYGLQVIDLVPEAVNVSLKDRRSRIQKIRRTFGECALISVHANAAGKGRKWHPAKGSRIFTRKTPPRNKPTALAAYHESRALAENLKMFIGRDVPLKKANFAILMVPIPAILFEAAFMTNEAGARKLASDSFRAEKVDEILKTLRYYNIPRINPDLEKTIEYDADGF